MINRSLLDKITSQKMMNKEKSDVFNIPERVLKQAAQKLLDIGKIPSNAVECSSNLFFSLRMI